MKQTIDKSKVMKRAWNIFKGNNPYSGNFSLSLRRAWFVEKDAIRYEVEKMERERLAEQSSRTSMNLPVSESFMKGAADYYRKASQGVYFGD